MSNPTTNYRVGGLDLSAIFQPLSQGSAIGYDTNYAVSGYGDLRNIFAAYTGAPGTQAPVTGYSVTGHGDLNTIFAKTPLYIITGSLTYDVYTYGGYTGIVFTGGTGTITYFIDIATTVIAVGGGGGGNMLLEFFPGVHAGTGGGGGGTAYIPNLNLNNNVLYNISVGAGGVAGNGYATTLQPGGNGGDSGFDTFTGGGGGGGGAMTPFGVTSGNGGATNTGTPNVNTGGGGGGGSIGYNVVAGVGGNNGATYQGNAGSASNGGTSFNNDNPIYLPFINGNPQLYPGNGGGCGLSSAELPTTGGLAGSTVGGLRGGAPDLNGESGVSSISTGVFGAGGGGGGNFTGTAGSGGSGVVIIYWQTV
jgi:hypothetical protein